MINNIQFTSGFPIKIPHIGNRIFNFNPGINILFGPNGCGKSTILKTLKAYSGISAGGGWTSINDPMQLASSSFPFAYMGITPSKCTANVSWDGTPSFFNDGDIKVNDTFFYMNEKKSDDGMTSMGEQLELLAEHPSSGQYRIKMFNKVFNMIRDIPSISVGDIPSGYNYKECVNEINYWKKLPHTGPQTIILDEPERGLSLALQKKVFQDVLYQFKDLQIILATHSIFCLNMKDVNFIEFEDGYINECRKIISI
jgi:energy-coupling factor transporter ATP-binding protein EcfA2